MKCPNCDHSNKAGARFCGECGASLTPVASNNLCPACGFANRRGVRFCEECGADLTAAATLPLPAQPAPPPRAGMPGWVWGLIGCGLVALMALAAILLWTGLPALLAASIATVPAGKPPVLVTVTAGGSAAASTAFCPQAGGVILFWNRDYNCDNDQGDPGYREWYGAGSQDVNNLQFDDQASAVMIPQGWSVKLYEGPGRTGANVCFNTSVTDFSAQGYFPGTSKSINDNVSSMETFADRQCGAELAAGATPAPLPPHRKGVAQPGVPPACDDVTHCACIPEELGNMGTDEFNAKYIEDSHIVGNKFEVIFKKDFGKIYDIIHNNPGLSLDIELWFKDQSRPGHEVNDIWSTTQREARHVMECVKSDLDGGTVRCTGNVTDADLNNFDHEADDDPIPGSGATLIAYKSDAVFDWCFATLPKSDNSNGLFLLQAIATPGGQCTVSGYSVVCGTECCRDNKKCCCFPNVGCQCVRSSCNCNNPKSSACSY